MITFLTSPKPWLGEAYNNQIRAIQSWLAIEKDIEVICYGNSEGADKINNILNIRYVPDIETNEFGTPLFSAIANHATQHAKHDLQAYVNCDILLTKEFLQAAKLILFPQFLMIGQRLNLSDGCFIDIHVEDWYKKLSKLVESKQVALNPAAGSDYFVFKRGMWSELQPIVIGRIGYDNYLIEYCLRRRIPVIDATLACPAFHQYHQCRYVTKNKKADFLYEEKLINLRSIKLLVSVCDATWQLHRDKLNRSFARGDLLRALEVYFDLILKQGTLTNLVRIFRKLFFKIGFSISNYTLFDLLHFYKSVINANFSKNR